MNLLQAFVQQVVVIEAAESLRHVTEFAIGSGGVKKSDSDRVIGEWRREATRGETRRAEIRRGDHGTFLRDAAAMGIEVTNG